MRIGQNDRLLGCGVAGVPPQPIVETTYGITICELALEGVGVGLVNPIIASDYLKRGSSCGRSSLRYSFLSSCCSRWPFPRRDWRRSLQPV